MKKRLEKTSVNKAVKSPKVSPQKETPTAKVEKRSSVPKGNGGARPAKAAKASGSKDKTPAVKIPARRPSKPTKVQTTTARPKRHLALPRTEAQYAATPERFKETWDRVVSVISRMRREKVSLTQASRDAGVSPRAVTKWGNSALRKGGNGKYTVTKQDSLLRIVLIPTSQGPAEIAVRGSKQVTLLAEYWNALHRYLQTGDATRLKRFEGKQIKDANGVNIPLLTDLSALNRLGAAGVLSFESIYARTV